jgi:DNA-binding transcriptional ArsR family regulator
MNKSLIAGLQSELSEKRKKVEKCEKALDCARADVESYVNKIADALGLKKPMKRGPKPKAERAPDEQEPDSRVAPAKPPSALSKREQVRLLYLDGKTVGEMATELDTTKPAIYQHLHDLRKSGLIEPREPATTPNDLPSEEPSEPDDGDEEDGASVADLRDEVARQQAGSRSKPVKIMACASQKHTHLVLVDRMGDGQTQPDETGHFHKIYRFVSSQAKGHSHNLRISAAP